MSFLEKISCEFERARMSVAKHRTLVGLLKDWYSLCRGEHPFDGPGRPYGAKADVRSYSGAVSSINNKKK